MNNTTTHAVVSRKAHEIGLPALPGLSACANNAVYRRMIPIVLRDLIISCDRSADSMQLHTSAIPCRGLSSEFSVTDTLSY
jgi:hypothetical protein